jgi:hypothetical protein
LVGDYYLPWGNLPDDNSDDTPIDVWGQRRLRYLKENRAGLYSELWMTEKLKGYLAELAGQAEMFSRLVKQMANREGVKERLEADDQMAWVGRMNSIRARAREIINNEMIYN